MATFTDNANRTWRVDVNVATLKKAKELAGVDLLEVLEYKLIDRLISDPVLLCDTLYAVCKREADERGVTDEDFASGLAGDALAKATDALLDAIVSFCPSPRDREILGRVLAAARRAVDKAKDSIKSRLDTGELDKAIDEALATPGDLSINAPASSV